MVWIGDYLPSYKLAPLLADLLGLLQRHGAAALTAMAASAQQAEPPAMAAGSKRTAAANATREWRAMRTVQVHTTADSDRDAAAAATLRIDVTFVSALPAHAVDESALQSAREAVLLGPREGKQNSAANVPAHPAALSACCTAECNVVTSGATARSSMFVAPLQNVSAVVTCLAAHPEVSAGALSALPWFISSSSIHTHKLMLSHHCFRLRAQEL